MIAAQLTRVEIDCRRHGWQFPPNRFVEYDQADEAAALCKGWSGWGGVEVVKGSLMVFPNCLITVNSSHKLDVTAFARYDDLVPKV